MIYLLVGLFALHAFLWFVRSLIDALRLGRPKRLSAEQPGVVAFAPIHRLLYGLLLLRLHGLDGDRSAAEVQFTALGAAAGGWGGRI